MYKSVPSHCKTICDCNINFYHLGFLKLYFDILKYHIVAFVSVRDVKDPEINLGGQNETSSE